jgi:hypothetical protein
MVEIPKMMVTRQGYGKMDPPDAIADLEGSWLPPEGCVREVGSAGKAVVSVVG